MTLRKKVGFCLAVVVIALACLGFWFTRQIACYLFVQKMRREQPWLTSVPSPLSDLATNDAKGTKFTRFGYSFETPWDDVENIRDLGSVTVVYFKSGHFVSLFDPSQQPKMLESMKGNLTPAQQTKLAAVFGHDGTDSDYGLERRILYSTPDNVSIFMRGEDAVGKTILLTMKRIYIYRQAAILSVQTSQVRGFQIGNPAQSKVVIVNLFDNQDRHIEFLVGTKDGSRATLTQSDLNRIIQSLAVPDSSATAQNGT